MKVDKYDRQIRLWGVKGQRKLGESKVALVGCSGAGIEAFKNLVLPGIGFIDIWDDTKITVQDLSSTFFYEYESVSTFKCQEALKNLLQMNPDVKGNSYKKSLKQFLNSEPETLRNYNLVIFGNNLTAQQIIETSLKMKQLQIPCIYIQIVGHYFYIRIQKSLHFVESSNSQASKKYYMNIDNPFQQLKGYSNKWNIYEMLEQIVALGKTEDELENNDKARQLMRQLANVPYSIILLQVFAKLPQDQRKRNFIVDELKSINKKILDKYRDNVNQAISRVMDLFQTADNFMNNFHLIDPSSQSTPLDQLIPSLSLNKQQWPAIVKFLLITKQFYKSKGRLPQPTNLPDMHSTTQNYIELKQIYKQKHSEDIQDLLKISQPYGSNEGKEGLNQDNISDFINNIDNLQVIAIKPYYQEIRNPDTSMFCYMPPNQQALYVALRAYQLNQSAESENLQQNSQQILQNVFNDTLLKGFSEEQANKNKETLGKYLQDISRSRGSNRNINICSMAGAITGQEAIKLISGCFCPMNSSYLFDGAYGEGYQISL